MKWSEAYEQVMLERDLAMQAKAIRDEAMRDLRDKLAEETTKNILKEMASGRMGNEASTRHML